MIVLSFVFCFRLEAERVKGCFWWLFHFSCHSTVFLEFQSFERPLDRQEAETYKVPPTGQQCSQVHLLPTSPCSQGLAPVFHTAAFVFKEGQGGEQDSFWVRWWFGFCSIFNSARSVLIIVFCASSSCQTLLVLLTSIVQQRGEILFGQVLAQEAPLPPRQSLTSKPVLTVLLSV